MKALEVAVYMFGDILDQSDATTLTPTDYKIFENYIFPAFVKLKNENAKDTYVLLAFINCLPLLA